MQSNRDVIVETITQMDEEQLGRFLSNFDIERIDFISCDECKAQNGGECPGGNDDCFDLDHAQWLSWQCRSPARLRAALTMNNL